MAKRISVNGYKAFKAAVEPYSKPDLVYCLFSGSKDETGKSWCHRCVTSEPLILAALDKYAKKHAVFIHAEIGNKDEFLSDNNPFKLDKAIRLTVIPDLRRWKHAWRLLGSYCTDEDLIKRFFLKHAD